MCISIRTYLSVIRENIGPSSSRGEAGEVDQQPPYPSSPYKGEVIAYQGIEYLRIASCQRNKTGSPSLLEPPFCHCITGDKPYFSLLDTAILVAVMQKLLCQRKSFPDSVKDRKLHPWLMYSILQPARIDLFVEKSICETICIMQSAILQSHPFELLQQLFLLPREFIWHRDFNSNNMVAPSAATAANAFAADAKLRARTRAFGNF